MSIALWAYEPTICDGDFCEGECDLCRHRPEDEEDEDG